ncbi:MAG TPA: DUF177 domain-containing protein [Saprospiraceae bacterium]|jgi:uncharacterized metal-binding protein YceD (DUF177 family)|nr:DUF177 domain-containing protein [Saprospiraceae bacterium]
MKDLKDFDISFIGLKDGLHQFEYLIEKEFFDFFNYDELNDSNVIVQLNFLKKATMFELNFSFSGWVELACDITNELFHQPTKTEFELIVKFGDSYNDENEELLIIPQSEFKVNVAQYIYETIVLALPIKRIHPGVADGTLKSEILDKLKELEPKQLKNKIDIEDIDPRWNKLKNILIDKNTSNGTS